MVPNIAIEAFCETDEVAAAWENAAGDRRMSNARMQVKRGGIGAAIERYRKSRTPDLVAVESAADLGELLPALDALADECLPGTKVVVIGHRNDVGYYRELVGRGVSDYLIAPVDVAGLATAIGRIYVMAGAPERGRVITFMAGRGGAGSSVLAHNCAWVMASRFGTSVLLGDVDLVFGTTGLNFNLEATHRGISDAIENAKSLDASMLAKLVATPHERLGVLTSPAALDKVYDLTEADFERLIAFARAQAQCSVLDLPHSWTPLVQKSLTTSDEIVLVATPDLASLRNTKSLLAALKKFRPNDPPPLLVLNQVGMLRRPEIKPQDFAEATGSELAVIVPSDPHLFGTAANSGKMLEQISSTAPATRAITQLAGQLTGSKAGGRSRVGGMVDRLLGRRRA